MVNHQMTDATIWWDVRFTVCNLDEFIYGMGNGLFNDDDDDNDDKYK